MFRVLIIFFILLDSGDAGSGELTATDHRTSDAVEENYGWTCGKVEEGYRNHLLRIIRSSKTQTSQAKSCMSNKSPTLFSQCKKVRSEIIGSISKYRRLKRYWNSRLAFEWSKENVDPKMAGICFSRGGNGKFKKLKLLGNMNHLQPGPSSVPECQLHFDSWSTGQVEYEKAFLKNGRSITGFKKEDFEYIKKIESSPLFRSLDLMTRYEKGLTEIEIQNGLYKALRRLERGLDGIDQAISSLAPLDLYELYGFSSQYEKYTVSLPPSLRRETHRCSKANGFVQNCFQKKSKRNFKRCARRLGKVAFDYFPVLGLIDSFKTSTEIDGADAAGIIDSEELQSLRVMVAIQMLLGITELAIAPAPAVKLIGARAGRLTSAKKNGAGSGIEVSQRQADKSQRRGQLSTELNPTEKSLSAITYRESNQKIPDNFPSDIVLSRSDTNLEPPWEDYFNIDDIKKLKGLGWKSVYTQDIHKLKEGWRIAPEAGDYWVSVKFTQKTDDGHVMAVITDPVGRPTIIKLVQVDEFYAKATPIDPMRAPPIFQNIFRRYSGMRKVLPDNNVPTNFRVPRDRAQLAMKMAKNQAASSGTAANNSNEIRKMAAGNHFLLKKVTSEKELTARDIERLAEISVGTPDFEASDMDINRFQGVLRGTSQTRRNRKAGVDYTLDNNSYTLTGQGRPFVVYSRSSEVPKRLDDLLLRVNRVDHKSSIREIVSIYQDYVRMHPFMDGNGRTGTMLLDYMMIRSGRPPVPHDQGAWMKPVQTHINDLTNAIIRAYSP